MSITARKRANWKIRAQKAGEGRKHHVNGDVYPRTAIWNAIADWMNSDYDENGDRVGTDEETECAKFSTDENSVDE